MYSDPFVLGPVTVTNDGTSLHAALPSAGIANVALVQNAGDAFDASIEEDGKDVSEWDAMTFYPGPAGPATYLVTRRGVALRTR